MNPYDYWFRTNKSLRIHIENSFNKKIDLLNDYPQLEQDCRYLFSSGNVSEKLQVLDLLHAYESIFLV